MIFGEGQRLSGSTVTINPPRLRMYLNRKGRQKYVDIPEAASMLGAIRPNLTLEQQQQMDKMSIRQMQALATLADESLNGEEWITQNFDWLYLHLINYVP